MLMKGEWCPWGSSGLDSNNPIFSASFDRMLPILVVGGWRTTGLFKCYAIRRCRRLGHLRAQGLSKLQTGPHCSCKAVKANWHPLPCAFESEVVSQLYTSKWATKKQLSKTSRLRVCGAAVPNEFQLKHFIKITQGFRFVEPKQPHDISIKFQTVLTTISSSTDVAVQHITHLLTT